MTYISDLELGSGWLCQAFCIPSHRGKHLSLIEILPGVKEICSGHEVQGSNL